MTIVKIFGRQPALAVAIIVSVIHIAGTAGLAGFTDANAGALVILIDAIGAAVLAYATRPLTPAAFLGLVSAALAFAGSYGLELPAATVTAINAAVYPFLAFIAYGNVSPVPTALTKASTNPTPEAAKVIAKDAGDDDSPIDPDS